MTKEADRKKSPLEHNKNTTIEPAADAQVPESGRRERIRALNDRLRAHATGGLLVVTSGIAALGTETMAIVLSAVAAFDAFDTDNDPWDEHDCAAMTVARLSVIWRIDYYDLDQGFHSPDPADPSVTIRILTVMLADEY